MHNKKSSSKLFLPSLRNLGDDLPRSFNDESKRKSGNIPNKKDKVEDKVIELNSWQREALDLYPSNQLSPEDFLSWSNKYPFIQDHLDVLKYLVSSQGFSPRQALNEILNLPWSLVKHLPKVLQHGISGEDFRTLWLKKGLKSIGDEHISLLIIFVSNNKQSIQESIDTISQLTTSDAKKLLKEQSKNVKETRVISNTQDSFFDTSHKNDNVRDAKTDVNNNNNNNNNSLKPSKKD